MQVAFQLEQHSIDRLDLDLVGWAPVKPLVSRVFTDSNLYIPDQAGEKDHQRLLTTLSVFLAEDWVLGGEAEFGIDLDCVDVDAGLFLQLSHRAL